MGDTRIVPERVVDPTGKEVDLFVVEYHRQGARWRPHSIVTDRGTWDADWSRSAGAVLVHDSGGGFREAHHVDRFADPKNLPGAIWLATGVPLRTHRGLGTTKLRDTALRPSQLAALGYKHLPSFPGDPFADVLNVDSIEWCEVCRDFHDGGSDAPCPHLRWSQKHCAMFGSGALWDYSGVDVVSALASMCDGVARDQGLERVVRLRKALTARRFRGSDLLEWDDKVEDHHRDAAAWLETLRSSRSDPMRMAVTRTMDAIDTWLSRAQVKVA